MKRIWGSHFSFPFLGARNSAQGAMEDSDSLCGARCWLATVIWSFGLPDVDWSEPNFKCTPIARNVNYYVHVWNAWWDILPCLGKSMGVFFLYLYYYAIVSWSACSVSQKIVSEFVKYWLWPSAARHLYYGRREEGERSSSPYAEAYSPRFTRTCWVET